MSWVVQQLRAATPYGLQPRYLFRDNDGIHGNGVRDFLDSCGIEEVRTAFRSPWQNPFIERYCVPNTTAPHVTDLPQSACLTISAGRPSFLLPLDGVSRLGHGRA